jgi:pimeloyl-ACP methyl ester carboxylesterase
LEKLNVNNLNLAFERHGSGNTLLLLHGFPLDHHLWDDLVPLLEDSFDLIIPDLRGFGESETIDTPYTMDDYASDLAGLLDQLGIQKSAVAGHSMGGYVALAFARLYLERVSGLALISSQVLADPPERKEGRYKSAADVAENGISSVVETMTPKFTSDARLQANAREIMEKQQPSAYIGALKAMAERMDSTALLSTFTFPVVVIHGDADALIPVDRAREVRDAVPGSHYLELKGIGHVPMLEVPEETAEAFKQLA